MDYFTTLQMDMDMTSGMAMCMCRMFVCRKNHI